MYNFYRSAMNPVQHNQEAVANTVLAQLLTQLGLNAQAETTVKSGWPDIFIKRQSDGARIYLETEYEPARTVDDDAKKRLTSMLTGSSARCLIAFAIKLPEALKNEDQRFLKQRFQDAKLKWRVWHAFRNPRKPKAKLEFSGGHPETGRIDELVRAIRTVEIEVYELENAVNILGEGACEAGDMLGGATISRLARNVFKNNKYKPARDAEETAQLSALIVINAMMFQERLAQKNPTYPPLLEPEGTQSWKEKVLKDWDIILDTDYFPIFKMACDVVKTLNSSERKEFLNVSLTIAQKVVELTKGQSHDLAGRIFNKLVADREFVKAYYTRIPTATLLAGLALAPHRWENLNWADAAILEDFRVLDPACGTGTLLMAAYKQIAVNAKIAELDDEQKRRDFHRTMVETAIHGFDVVLAAVHLAAATLASISPEAIFTKMNLAAPKLGLNADGSGHLGSLDFLDSNIAKTSFRAEDENGAQSKFEEVQEAVKPHSLEKDTVTIPQADLVIANPPYVRFGKGKKKKDNKLKSRIFGQFEEDCDTLSSHLSKKLRGTGANQNAGLASAFIVLADKYVKPNGRIAFVLPSTAISGASWANLRYRISERYDVEFIISAQVEKSQSLSFDTSINEVLLIARKLVNGDKPTNQATFVNLSSLPVNAYEANLLAREINKIADQNAINKISGAPVGGTVIGGEFVDTQWRESSKWGEAVVVPINSGVWSSAVWQAGSTGQYAWNLYKKGILWNADGTRTIHKFQLPELQKICNISAYHLQIKGTQGAFDVAETYDIQDQFPALYKLKSSDVQSMRQEPNAHLSPKQNSNHEKYWSGAGHLQIAPELGYRSQSCAAVYTERKTLGVRSWHTLTFKDAKNARAYEIALVLWLNSTLHLCCQIAHSSYSQTGRGTMTKTVLHTLPVLDVTKLKDWQLNAAQKIWDGLKDKEFQTFNLCHEDNTRIELDERLLKDVFGLDANAVEAVARIRELLVQEPRVHGGKKPPS